MQGCFVYNNVEIELQSYTDNVKLLTQLELSVSDNILPLVLPFNLHYLNQKPKFQHRRRPHGRIRVHLASVCRGSGIDKPALLLGLQNVDIAARMECKKYPRVPR
jgi:hypothetical protein